MMKDSRVTHRGNDSLQVKQSYHLYLEKPILLFSFFCLISLLTIYNIQAQAYVQTQCIFSQGLNTWVVPAHVTQVRISALGARGGDKRDPGGRGALMQGDFTVTPGQTLNILVGGRGGNSSSTTGSVSNTSGAGGGGGTFVWEGSFPTTTLLIAAGGGGGGSKITDNISNHASITTAGNMGYINGGVGGINGNGGIRGFNGTPSVSAGGGAGWLTNGDIITTSGGRTPQNGAAGGVAVTSTSGNGGYGGGGGGGFGGGGGGGYSGGGGGGWSNPGHSGGGGGSFNGGANQDNSNPNVYSDAYVLITYLGLDADGDGYVRRADCGGNDCDDNNNMINPDMAEICDGIDNDCDGDIDEDITMDYFADIDLDGYGDANTNIYTCNPPIGYITDATDCDDTNFNINPGKTEIIGNGVDDNCDGLIDLNPIILYAMTNQGGSDDAGVIFKYSPNTNTYDVLHEFDYSDGGSPKGDLMSFNNKFYGMTNSGGSDEYGVIFEYDPTTNTYSVLHEFNYSDGGYPNGNLFSFNDKLYGMTNSGGSDDAGVIFEYDPATETYSVLHEFNYSNGGSPEGDLMSFNDKLYGMTNSGGSGDAGVIFEYDPATETYNVLHEFNYSDGGSPEGNLMSFNDKLYALTKGGGSDDVGVIFEYDPLTETYTVLHEFSYSDGSQPTGSLIEVNGKLYGMTSEGGNDDAGVVFEYDISGGNYTLQHNFEYSDGGYPYGSFIQFFESSSTTAAPVISCPSNIEVNTEIGDCESIVSFAAIETIGNPASTISYSQNPGTVFPVGQTTVTATATNAVGSDQCTFIVTVNDSELPDITCPGNITTNTDESLCTAVETYTTPSGTDNCSVQTTSQTAGLASGSAFPVGVTTNTFKVTDASSNTKTCSFTVTVNDTELPAITCPSNIVTDNDAGACTAVESYTAPSGTDNCSGQSTTQTSGLESGAAFPLGVTTNTFKVTDASSNTKTCSFTITVNDTELPAITCPSNIVTDNDADACTAVESYTAPSGTDNCSGQSTTQTAGLGSGAAFPVGVTTNTFKVTDASSNSKTCSFTVTVNDTELPAITCPSNIVTDNDAGACTAVESYTAPSGTDNCSGQSTAQTAGLASGAAYPLGVTTNTFKVTDASSNTKTCSFTVTVNDTELPVITCPSNIVTDNDAGVCTAVESYIAPSGTDNCSGQSTTQTSGLGSGAAFPIGLTTNTFKVTDASGNTATCSFTITVNHIEVPTICPDIEKILDIGANTAVVELTVETDNCSSFTTTFTPESGSTFEFGTTAVTAIVTDEEGNTTICNFNVHVIDLEPPVAICPLEDVELDAIEGHCFGEAEYSTSYSDNVEVDHSYFEPFTSNSRYDVGTTLVTYTVVDISGNSSFCTFNVVVYDSEDPVLTCPDTMKVQLDAGICSKTIWYTSVASDNCSDPTVVYSPLNGSTLGIGNTFVNGTVTDGSSNSATCSFVVNIKAASEICDNNLDDDCDGQTDEGCNDIDGDGIENSADNCPLVSNPGQEDSDCDGVGNVCDVCPGGNDKIDNDNNGLPDCKYKPFNYSTLHASWKCGSNKAYVCHIVGNYNTLCISWNAIQAHLNHGDYLGPCNQAKCNNTVSKDEREIPSLEQFNENHEEELSIDITPNPNDGNFVLHLDGLHEYHGIIEIVNISGKVIYYSEVDEPENHVHLNLDLRNLVEGNYLLKYKDKEYVFNKLIVIVK